MGFSFNTQPPEGGCRFETHLRQMSERFQHTAARRRLPRIARRLARCPRCFNTQPPEGGCPEDVALPNIVRVSTHSRPKAAADNNCVWQFFSIRFQHTAARRRLRDTYIVVAQLSPVSTHSRPKAAAYVRCRW